jgi:hypothetical protein
MLRVVTINAIMLSVILLSSVMLIVIKLRVILLIISILSVTKAPMLCKIMLNVVILNFCNAQCQYTERLYAKWH